MNYCIAVLDVGKTNKKLSIYDDRLNRLDVSHIAIGTSRDDDLDVENVAETEAWFLENLRQFARHYPIGIISVATHASTAVCLNADGSLALPVVAYTNEVAPSPYPDFFAEMGAAPDLQRRLATSEVHPLINLGVLLFFLRHRFRDRWAAVRWILPYPQYFGFRLTGVATADITSIGSHTYLWDFNSWHWSHIIDRLDIADKLPPAPRYPHEVLGTLLPEVAKHTGLSADVPVTVGIHDSNSSLLPYLIARDEDFILNSTGTWCVAMHPMSQVQFDDDELGKMIYFNISPMGTPVKTSILLAGLEFEVYSELLARINPDRKPPPFREQAYSDLLRTADSFILPSVVSGSGQFPDARAAIVEDGRRTTLADIQADIHDRTRIPALFRDYERAIAALNVSLALQTKVALQRVNIADGGIIYLEGGFRHNDAYIGLLASLFPNARLCLTDLDEATSYGAAIIAKAAKERRTLPDLRDVVTFDSQQRRALTLSTTDLHAYERRFLQCLT